MSVLAHPQLAFNPERATDIYELWYEELYAASDYPDLLGFPGKIPIGVVAGGSMLAASEFIALSPLIGARLGWRMSSEGLFRGGDDAGQIMAESISWADGNTEVYDSGDLYASASRGWLVLASPAGWFQIRPLMWVTMDAKQMFKISPAGCYL